MMEYRVVFRTGGHRDKAERMEAANPLSAVNRVLREWENVTQICRIEAVFEEEVGEGKVISDLEHEYVGQITINVSK